MENIYKVETEIAGKKLSLEAGHLAKQAGGAVVVRYADTVVLVTATCSAKPREGIDFFPLTVDYEEKLYAAGKIPGGFIKKEGRPSEKAVLTSRLIDRTTRPLFPEGFRNDVQITALPLSADQENDSDIPAMIGAGAALTISDIPFSGPIAAVRIGIKNGEYVINPTFQVLNETDKLNLIVAGTKDAINMVEAGSNEVTEEEVIKAFKIAHDQIKIIIDLINELKEKCGKPKAEFPVYEPDADLENIIRSHFTEEVKKAIRVPDKAERGKAFDRINKEAVIEVIKEKTGSQKERLIEILTDDKNHDFSSIIKKMQEEEFKNLVVDDGIRPDGRSFDQIRPISCMAGILPRTHGSGLFTRGQTQVLSISTLGTFREEQRLDGLGGDECKRYMHHYYFPAFSVGEARSSRGPGRREIGHGALAERALIPMLPGEEEFPYTIRVVSEVLESNGSTSMASVCGSTLSLMDAGVPLKKPVAGIAMGMISKNDDIKILTDIQGMEDMLGEMDFKVAGTREGITALQMDIKIKGITQELLGKALQQAKDARLFILDKIAEVLPSPRKELSAYAPRMFTLQIDVEKIKDVIGPGGKIINKIINETGVKMDIEQDGKVYIASVDAAKGEEAVKRVLDLTKDVEAGETYNGKVVRLMDFGAFVEILPGKDGLVHISQFSYDRVDKIEDVAKVGDEITVKVTEIDSMGRINLSRKALLTPPEGYKERPQYDKPRRSPGGGDRKPGGRFKR
ncbi:MAG: polyribonucleotide nucleotidyltransferase [Armatimonadota bacterium]